jgi:hypothetical protein
MAEKKMDAGKPKAEDVGGNAVSVVPTADTPVGPSGTPLSPNESLEKQREGFVNAEKASKEEADKLTAEGKDPTVKGEQADLTAAQQAPEDSGPAGTKAEDLKLDEKAETAKQATPKAVAPAPLKDDPKKDTVSHTPKSTAKDSVRKS